MRGRGLLVAGIASLLVGLLGLVVTGAFLASRDASRYDDARREWERRYDSDGGGESTSAPGPGVPRGPGGFDVPREFSSAGERIWYTGVGSEGSIPRDPSYGPAMMGGCATCHGEDGRGTRFFMMRREYDAPDIRYSTLSREHTEDGRTEEPWTDEDIKRAVREGVEPDGERLEDTMPRWDISDADFAALLEYMKRF